MSDTDGLRHSAVDLHQTALGFWPPIGLLVPERFVLHPEKCSLLLRATFHGDMGSGTPPCRCPGGIWPPGKW